MGERDDLAVTAAALLPDAVLIVDLACEVVWANPAAEQLFGVRLEDARGMSGLDLIHPDDLTVALLALTSVQGKEVGTPLEVRVRAHDGWRLVEVIGRSVGEDRLLIALRDLTERRRWEVAGNEPERARVIVQHAASITVLLDAAGVVRTSSGGLTRNLGIDQEAIEGCALSTLVRGPDSDRIDRALADVRPGAPVTVEVGLVHHDGHVIPHSLTFVDLRDDPTVEGFVVSGHDITDRAHVEAELRSAFALLQATFDSTADGILVVDRDGKITGCNERFAEIWELPEEVRSSDDDSVALAHVVSKLADPAGFIAKVEELYSQPEAESHDQVLFADGRVIERDTRPQRVDGRVVGRVWSFRDITATVRLQQELSHQAFHDPLTGLANQALFRDRVEHATVRLGRYGGRLAVLFVDVDDFKTINDSLGHATGDELLRVVSTRLLQCVRSIDTVARLGGDEFALLIEDVASELEVVAVAQRVNDALHRPITLDGRDVVVSASVGIAYGEPGSGSEDLLRNADLAMYTAKGAGKNGHRTFEPEMHAAALERLETEARLRGAAARGELVVHYQPVVDLDTGLTEGFEALVRWQHPERGLLPPGAFIAFAEQVGLIDEIGTHVLTEACEEAAGWAPLRDGLPAPSINVNLSPRQLLDPELPERLAGLLRRTGLEPSRLVLELTEGALMSDPLAAITSLRSLESLGVRLAVDDFGTGYSSLAYLQQFPIHILKVDRSFVSDLQRESGSPLAAAIVQLCRTLHLVPIAEGVETPAQQRAVQALGCRLAQGYLLGSPEDAVSARRRLDAERSSYSSRSGTRVQVQ